MNMKKTLQMDQTNDTCGAFNYPIKTERKNEIKWN